MNHECDSQDQLTVSSFIAPNVVEPTWNLYVNEKGEETASTTESSST